MNRANDLLNLIGDDLENDFILGAIEAIVAEEGEHDFILRQNFVLKIILIERIFTIFISSLKVIHQKNYRL